MSKRSVEQWLKRASKRTYYLVETKNNQTDGIVSYKLIWKDSGKVKIGWISDGTCVRYGFETLATIREDGNLATLWQHTTNQNDVKVLLSWVNNEIEFPIFDIKELKNLEF